MAEIGSRIKAVIFDLDGTLVTSSLDFPRMRKDIGCPEGQDVLQFIESLDESAKLRAQAIIHRHEMDDAQSVLLIPGALSLLGQLQDLGIYTAIVTRNSMAPTQLNITRSGLQVGQVLTRECAPAKPHPGALLQLCEGWQIKPSESLYVGDYLYDLQAAANANMHSCLFVSGDAPPYAAEAGFVCRQYAVFLGQLSAYLDAATH